MSSAVLNMNQHCDQQGAATATVPESLCARGAPSCLANLFNLARCRRRRLIKIMVRHAVFPPPRRRSPIGISPFVRNFCVSWSWSVAGSPAWCEMPKSDLLFAEGNFGASATSHMLRVLCMPEMQLLFPQPLSEKSFWGYSSAHS